MTRTLTAAIETFRLVAPFVIARGAKTVSTVVVATIQQGEHRGRGECVPYGRYGETADSVLTQIASLRNAIENGADREALQSMLPAGAARNAVDCALWDLEAKRLGLRAETLAGLHRIGPATTAYTLSLGTPDSMADAARAAAERPLLKLKLGGAGDPDRIAAVRAAAPDAELIVDANEAWRDDDLDRNFAACVAAHVALVEQPLPAGQDSALARMTRPVPVCADESVHDRNGLAALVDRYDVINIKLDKTGGLTEALALADEGERLGFGLFVGCMVGTSLAMAPAMLLAPRARFVDLDGPLLLAEDRPHGLVYDGSMVYPPSAELWG
ncbi:dipeptide epimerase [Lichenihabitans sp. PAMC28606]|uniref:N-acetyl-D-Glu racemase DgcA n=1 Tax=Lichenihabitans sp. PAMC28606 TaxID=2880932 RepID=UPI001D0BBFFB|nr:N-acetyl-D-Glu racemase DgcA [Lichenihabitans sp. PAMC28606]UDL94629.1 dipeptide epimerase [Lichenihabitans sp. PAMC28606]